MSSVETTSCPMCGAELPAGAKKCIRCGESVIRSGSTPHHSLLASARRELLTTATIWLIALVWSVGYCAKYGYHLKPEDLTFTFGIPSWVFYGVLLPWGLCTAISGVYAFGYMQDFNLGETDGAPPAPEGDNAAE